jgi:hypothetical protein
VIKVSFLVKGSTVKKEIKVIGEALQRMQDIVDKSSGADRERHEKTLKNLKANFDHAMERYDVFRETAMVKRIKDKCGDVEGWFEWARSLYDIVPEANGTYTVRSKARNWKNTVEWTNLDRKIDAQEKIEKLVGYKIHDRQRGHGDVEKDMEKNHV